MEFAVPPLPRRLDSSRGSSFDDCALSDSRLHECHCRARRFLFGRSWRRFPGLRQALQPRLVRRDHWTNGPAEKMTAQQAPGSEYDARLRRAVKLIAGKSSASELLSFYRRVAAFQKSMVPHVACASARQSELRSFGTVRGGLDLTFVLPHFRIFLSLVEQNAPKALSAAAREVAAMPADSWISLLTAYSENGGRSGQQIGAFAQFIPRAFLQPYAACFAAQLAVPTMLATAH